MAGTRRAQHRTETPERGAPEDQGKSGTTHHDTHGTDTTHIAHTQRTPATRPAVGGQPGEGQGLTPGAPHNGGRHPPRGRPSATPTASNAGPQGRTLWGRCWVPTRAPTAPGTRGSPNPGCPLQRTGGRGGQRLTPGAPHNGGRHPSPGTPFRRPHSEQRRPARTHAVGPVLCPHARIDRARDTRVAEPWLPAPEDGQPGEGQRLTPGAPPNGGRHPPGDALPPPPQRAMPARKGARCGAGAGSTRPHRPHPGHTGRGTLAARSRGRAVGGGTAPDTRRPSQRWKAPPPETPFFHPHSEQRRPARAHAGGPVLGSHARIDRTRDTRVAEPWLPARKDGRPGEGQRLTPGAPHNGGRHPPRGRSSATPTASNAGPQGRTLWGRCWVHTPASTAHGTHGSRNPGCPLQRTGGRGRDSARHQAPRTTVEGTPPGTPFPHPHSEQRRPARAGAVGPVLGPHARIDRTRDTRVAEPWLPAPEDGRSGEGQRLTPGAPHNGGRHPPRGRPSATPTASNTGPQGRTLGGRCWVHTPVSTAPGTHGSRNPGCPPQRTDGRGRDSA